MNIQCGTEYRLGLKLHGSNLDNKRKSGNITYDDRETFHHIEGFQYVLNGKPFLQVVMSKRENFA